MADTTITAKFRTDDAAIAWFEAARYAGLFSPQAGLRRGDALDSPMRRATDAQLVVSDEAGIGGWVIEPIEDKRGLTLIEARELVQAIELARSANPDLSQIDRAGQIAERALRDAEGGR